MFAIKRLTISASSYRHKYARTHTRIFLHASHSRCTHTARTAPLLHIFLRESASAGAWHQRRHASFHALHTHRTCTTTASPHLCYTAHCTPRLTREQRIVVSWRADGRDVAASGIGSGRRSSRDGIWRGMALAQVWALSAAARGAPAYRRQERAAVARGSRVGAGAGRENIGFIGGATPQTLDDFSINISGMLPCACLPSPYFLSKFCIPACFASKTCVVAQPPVLSVA